MEHHVRPKVSLDIWEMTLPLPLHCMLRISSFSVISGNCSELKNIGGGAEYQQDDLQYSKCSSTFKCCGVG